MLFSFILFRVRVKNGLFCHVRFIYESLQKYASSRTTGILSLQYIENNYEDIRRHVEPFLGFAEVLIPFSVRVLLETARDYDQDITPNGFVFGNSLYIGKFVINTIFLGVLAKELSAIWITMAHQKERNFISHDFQHTFVTLSYLTRISDVENRVLTNHKDVAVMQRYSNVLTFQNEGGDLLEA